MQESKHELEKKKKGPAEEHLLAFLDAVLAFEKKSCASTLIELREESRTIVDKFMREESPFFVPEIAAFIPATTLGAVSFRGAFETARFFLLVSLNAEGKDLPPKASESELPSPAPISAASLELFENASSWSLKELLPKLLKGDFRQDFRRFGVLKYLLFLLDLAHFKASPTSANPAQLDEQAQGIFHRYLDGEQNVIEREKSLTYADVSHRLFKASGWVNPNEGMTLKEFDLEQAMGNPSPTKIDVKLLLQAFDPLEKEVLIRLREDVLPTIFSVLQEQEKESEKTKKGFFSSIFRRTSRVAPVRLEEINVELGEEEEEPSLEDVLSAPESALLFLEFCRSIRCEEQLLFWWRCVQFRLRNDKSLEILGLTEKRCSIRMQGEQDPASDAVLPFVQEEKTRRVSVSSTKRIVFANTLLEEARQIVDLFLLETSPLEVVCAPSIRASLAGTVYPTMHLTSTRVSISRKMFQEMEDAVWMALERDVLWRYLLIGIHIPTASVPKAHFVTAFHPAIMEKNI